MKIELDFIQYLYDIVSVGRLFVERCIHDEFLERMVEEVKKMKIGDPLDRSVAHGPQNHE